MQLRQTIGLEYGGEHYTVHVRPKDWAEAITHGESNPMLTQLELTYLAARRMGLPMPATFDEFLDRVDDIDMDASESADDALNPTVESLGEPLPLSP